MHEGKREKKSSVPLGRWMAFLNIITHIVKHLCPSVNLCYIFKHRFQRWIGSDWWSRAKSATTHDSQAFEQLWIHARFCIETHGGISETPRRNSLRRRHCYYEWALLRCDFGFRQLFGGKLEIGLKETGRGMFWLRRRRLRGEMESAFIRVSICVIELWIELKGTCDWRMPSYCMLYQTVVVY